MELQDEFQFKPINEGLGFHKKRHPLNLDSDQNTNISALSLVEDELPQKAEKVKPLHNNNKYQHRSSTHPVFQQKDKEIPSISDPGIQFDSEIDKNVFDETQRIMTDQSDIFSSPFKPYTQSQNLTSTPQSPSHKINATPGSTQWPLTQPQNSPQPQSQSSYTPPSHPIYPNASTTGPTTHHLDPLTSQKTQTDKAKASLSFSQKVQNHAPHLGAWLLDLFIIVGLIHIFIVPLLMITQVNASYILTNVQSDLALQISLTILFLAVLNFYLMTTRCFFGATLGEWACDIALGNVQKRNSPTYPILVAWRCFVMTITGVITLPFLGLLTRKDILGKFTFIQLTKSS